MKKIIVLNKIYLKLLSVIALSIFSVMAPASTDGLDADEARFNMYISAYRPRIDTSIRLDSNRFNFGTDINLEDSTDLEDRKTLGALSLSYRTTNRAWIEFSHLELARSGSRKLDAEIRFGDEIFEVNESIDTEFDVNITRVGVGYAFYVHPRLSMGIASGLHVTKFDIGISAVGRNVGQSAEETAPLPYIGINLDSPITKRLKLGGQMESFGMEVNDIDGSLINATFALEYKFSHYMSLGAGVNYYELKVSSSGFSGDLFGVFEYTYNGPLLYVRFGL